MYPTQLELQVLQAERLREAQNYRLALSLRDKPTLLQRLFARFNTPQVTVSLREEEALCYDRRQTATSR